MKNNKIIIKKYTKTAKIRKPSKSGQDRHLPGDPKNGQKRLKCHISGFQETDILGAKRLPERTGPELGQQTRNLRATVWQS